MNQQVKITPTGTDLLKEGTNSEPITATAVPQPNYKFELNPNGKPLFTAPIEPIAPDVSVQPLKVAIIGTAPSSRMLAPFNDPAWKIWSCSPGNRGVVPRYDEWYEIHANLLWPECVSYGAPYLEWLKTLTCPVFMQNNVLVPNATTFPKDQLVKEFGPYFFTSSFAWMMAFAIVRGAKEIALFGVDMASKDEYILQRPGGHFFMWEANRRGIKVSVPAESDLCQPPQLYGYSETTPFGRKVHVRKQELNERISQMRADRDKLTHNLTYLEGAAEDLDYISSIWGGVQSHS